MKRKPFIGGKKVSRKEALKGLGDPKTWAKFRERVMKDFRQKPLKRKVKLQERKLGRENANGLSWGPKERPGKRNTIEIDPRQSARSRMNTILHEGLHQLDDHLTEKAVRKFAAFLSSLLYRDGYRRIMK